MIHSCPARSGFDWYVECFRFHKKNLWFSFALFMFVAAPGFLFNMVPVIGIIVGAAVSIFAQSGYLLAIRRMSQGELFKPDYLWMGFTDRDTRKALLPWIFISSAVSVVFMVLIASVFAGQSLNNTSEFALANAPEIIMGMSLLFFIYISIEIIIFFWIAPIATFQKLPFGQTFKLGLDGMAANVKPMLVHALVGIALMVPVLLLGVLIASPMLTALYQIKEGADPAVAMVAGSILVSGLGGIAYFLAITFMILPALALMPYFIYQSIYEGETFC